MHKVLVVDDEESILQLVTFNLDKAGFKTVAARDGEEALEVARRERPDLVILDIMMPKLDGLDVCRVVQREYGVPVLFLTARDEELDRVLGLEMGADDYVTKPFSPRELVARVKAILRRGERAGTRTRAIARGELVVDLDRHEVLLGGRRVDLTPKEYELLEYLASNAGRAVSRDQLLGRVWGDDFFGDTRIVDVHVSHLREKLADDPTRPRYIETVRGLGYRFRQGEDD